MTCLAPTLSPGTRDRGCCCSPSHPAARGGGGLPPALPRWLCLGPSRCSVSRSSGGCSRGPLSCPPGCQPDAVALEQPCAACAPCVKRASGAAEFSLEGKTELRGMQATLCVLVSAQGWMEFEYHQHHKNTAGTSMLSISNLLSHGSLSSAMWQRQEQDC